MIRRAYLFLFILVFWAPLINAQDLSVFDKARLIKSTRLHQIRQYQDKNYLFNKATIDAGASYNSSLSPFDRLGQFKDLIEQPDLIEKVNYIKDTCRERLDFTLLIKFQAMSSALSGVFAEIDTTKTMSDSAKVVAMSLLERPNPDEIKNVVGTGGTPIGFRFFGELFDSNAQISFKKSKEKKRANTFFNELEKDIQSSEAAQVLFPNTKRLLETRDKTRVPSMGTSWQNAFELDLQEMTSNLLSLLNDKLTERKEEWETIEHMVNVLKTMQQGAHPLNALDDIQGNLSDQSILKEPARLLNLIANSLINAKYSGNDVFWTQLSDYNKIGKDGQAMYYGFLSEYLALNEFQITSVTESDLESLHQQTQVLIVTLEKIQLSIASVKSKPEESLVAYDQLSNATVDLFTVMNDYLSDSLFAKTRKNQKNEVLHKSNELTGYISLFSDLAEMEKMIVAKEFAKLVPKALGIIESIDDPKVELPNEFVRIANFVTNVVFAQTSEDLQAIIDAAITPVKNKKIKEKKEK